MMELSLYEHIYLLVHIYLLTFYYSVTAPACHTLTIGISCVQVSNARVGNACILCLYPCSLACIQYDIILSEFWVGQSSIFSV